MDTAVNAQSAEPSLVPQSGHGGVVEAIAWSPDGSLIATVSNDHSVRVWDVDNRHLVHVLRGHTGAVVAVAFTPDSRMLVTGARDKTVRLWDLRSGVLARTFTHHTWEVGEVAVSPDGRQLATSSSSDLQIVDISTGRIMHNLKGHESRLRTH